MNTVTKNLIFTLGIVAVVAVGYYVFTQDPGMFISDPAADQQLERLFASSELFLERSQTLAQIQMDTRVFSTPIFVSLKDFSTEPAEYTYGRIDPFTPASGEAITIPVE